MVNCQTLASGYSPKSQKMKIVSESDGFFSKQTYPSIFISIDQDELVPVVRPSNKPTHSHNSNQNPPFLSLEIYLSLEIPNPENQNLKRTTSEIDLSSLHRHLRPRQLAKRSSFAHTSEEQMNGNRKI